MRHISFRTKIFCCVLLATLAALALPIYYVRVTLHNDLLREAQMQALREAQLAGRLLDNRTPTSNVQKILEELGTADMRLTLLEGDGKVLADSQIKADKIQNMDNHSDRPEFRAALRDGQGVSTRFSNTLNNDLIYATVLLPDGNLLRVALPFAGLKNRIDSQIGAFSGVALAAAAISLLLAWLLSFWLKRELGQMVSVVEAISFGKYQRRLRRLPGREFAVLAEAVNRMAQNIEEQVSTVAEQKEQLESILDTMSEGVLVLGQQGCIRRCNRALAQTFPAAAGAHGAQVVEIIPVPALQDAVDEVLHSPIAEGQSPKPFSLHMEMPPGRFFAVQLCRARRPGPNMGAVAVFHDITALQRLERVRRDFVANVSHELRTPLTAIQGYAETLADMEDMPADCRRFGEIIRKNGQYLNRMVEELLSLARLENEHENLPLAPVSVDEPLHSALSLCRVMLEKKSLRVDEALPGKVMVRGHAPSLTQVFRNLLENAARYAPYGSHIAVFAQEQHGMLLVRVCDNGPGIPPSDLQRVFERFYRVEKHRTSGGSATTGSTTGPNTGLGLAICKHVVERHGGRIWAESPIDAAAPFDNHWATALCFTLPLASSGE